jgi:aspartate/methionine/tyrosine aminotransferase
MKHPSAYLEWYLSIPPLPYDLRSSGITGLKIHTDLGEVDLSKNFPHGNPETTKLLAQRYHTQPENVFITSEGATGQNTRIISYLAEKHPKKTEAIIEYPTYEPLLRLAQDHFRRIKRLERKPSENYKLNADRLKKIASEKTSILMITNTHAPSGAVSDTSELKEILEVARESNFYVVCDEIYAEFERETVPTVFSIDSHQGIMTTSFTKAYGLDGLKLGVALAKRELVDELYTDVLNTVGHSPNVVQLLASKLLKKKTYLEKYGHKWMKLKKETEEWLEDNSIPYYPNPCGVTYWTQLPIKDTYEWVNEHAIPKHHVVPVPGAFFFYKNDYKLAQSDMVRIGVGNINPDDSTMSEALEALKKSILSYKTAHS